MVLSFYLLVERLVHLVILWWTPSSSCHTWHSASLIRLVGWKGLSVTSSWSGCIIARVLVQEMRSGCVASSGASSHSMDVVWQGVVIMCSGMACSSCVRVRTC